MDSEFEADVAAMLRARGLRVLHQYPACGFNIDLVASRESDGIRIAIECDGEQYHLDEHGELRLEDIERQAILERAGWFVMRVPYRKWCSESLAQVNRVFEAMDRLAEAEKSDNGYDDWNVDSPADDTERSREPPGRDNLPWPSNIPMEGHNSRSISVSREQEALISALKEGLSAEEDVFKRSRDLLGSKRLTQKLRRTLHSALPELAKRNLIAIEDGEYFLLANGREATFSVRPVYRRPRGTYHGRYRRY